MFHLNYVLINSDGTYIEKNSFTVTQFIDKWLEEVAMPKFAPITINGYKKMKGVVDEKIGFYKLNELRPLHLISFYNELRTRTVPRKLTENTILHYYTFINVVLNYAVKWQLITYNPNKNVDRPKKEKKEAKCYNVEQTKTLLKALDNESPKYRALILLAIDTGALRGEITGLEWGDIDLERGILGINKTTQALNGKIIEKLPKKVFILIKPFKIHR